MARRFSFYPDEFQVSSIEEFRRQWSNVPDEQARNVIAVEAQYLEFHQYVVASVRHEPVEGGERIPIGLSVRAGAIKTAILICASIAEAVLRAHAEARGYALPRNSRARTFGRVLGAWQERDGTPHPDVAPIWEELQRLHEGRNNVHLYRAVDEGDNFYDILDAEGQSLREAEAVLRTLQGLVST